MLVAEIFKRDASDLHAFHAHTISAQELKHGVLRHLAFLHLQIVVEARPFKLVGFDCAFVDQAPEAFAPAGSGQRLRVNRRYFAL